MIERLLRWLTYGALVLELHALYGQVKDRTIDAELRHICEMARRP